MSNYYNFFIKQNKPKRYFNFLKEDFISKKLDDYYFQMRLIRSFEEKLLDLFSKNLIHGTTHTYIGQEINSSVVFNHIDYENDIIWSNHRCHGHFISYCALIVELMAEILGKRNGICNGRGGSQHLHFKNFYSNGILGGSLPIAVGSAYANKLSKKGISIIFIGDGTLGSGYLYESMNMSSLWNCPLLIVCENNNIAQTTPSKKTVSGEVLLRAKSFGIKTFKSNKSDILKLEKVIKTAAAYVRNKNKPAFVEISSIRLAPHSKGDDTRSKHELQLLYKNDPLKKIQKSITNYKNIDHLCDDIINKCFLISETFEDAE